MLRPSTFLLGSGVALGVAAVVVYAVAGSELLAGLLMLVAVTDGVIAVFLRQRPGR
jgi:hypothetical protein